MTEMSNTKPVLDEAQLQATIILDCENRIGAT